MAAKKMSISGAIINVLNIFYGHFQKLCVSTLIAMTAVAVLIFIPLFRELKLDYFWR